MTPIEVMCAVGGAFVLVGNIKIHLQFDKFCKRVAAEKGERDLLDSQQGGSDLGYTGYRDRLYRTLRNGEIDPDLSTDLKREADRLIYRWSVMRGATVLYVLLLVAIGTLNHW